MLMLNWPLVFFTTVVLYILIIITLPFNAVYATVFLFALIAFWSRMPGVGIPHPLFILYNTDLVDLFCLIVAINIGGVYGAVFVIFGNMVSRLCGVLPEWGAVISDTILMCIVCLIIPFLHAAMGGDILISMIVFTAIRAVLWIPFDFIFWHVSIAHKAIAMVVGGGSLFLFNIFYAKLFGNFLDSLLKKGVQFSWILFLFATVVILVFYLSVFRSSKSVKTISFTKILRKQIHKRKRRKKIIPQHVRDAEMDEMKNIRGRI